MYNPFLEVVDDDNNEDGSSGQSCEEAGWWVWVLDFLN
jgi:hypothetical protein